MKNLIIIVFVALFAVTSYAQEQPKDSLLSVDLQEVVVVGSGFIDLAEDRKTPSAASTLTAEDFELRGTGNVEFAETLKMVPGIYVASTAGGFGEAEVFTRGFNQANTALLLNGQPINSVEDGLVYWSNWSGMADVAQTVQVQRGLGSSKLAISSVGGTINIVTKTTESKRGGFLRQVVGSNEYFKTSLGYNTGISDSGLSFSMMIDHWQGARKWSKSTKAQGQIYFFSLGFRPNSSHNFNLMFTGAPQWHHQAFSQSLSYFDEYGKDANSNGGVYQGEEHSERRNFYHKPVANLTWDWNIDEDYDLSTVLYGSWGRGGGTGGVGNGRIRLDNREIDFEGIEDRNILDSDSSGYGGYGGFYLRRASMNIHDWYGAISNLKFDNGGPLTFNIGYDVRTYTGTHFRQIVNFYGLNGYTDNYRMGDRPDGYTITKSYPADPWAAFFGNYADEDQRYDRDYSETINYFGGFAQMEYATDNFTAFVQGAYSGKNYQRTGRHEGYGDGMGKSTKIHKTGYNLKGGLSFKLADEHQIFANAGFYSRQPYFESLIDDSRYSNSWINDGDVDNEEILGFEAGYRFENNDVRVMLDGYYTNWGNRYVAFSTQNAADEDLFYRLFDVTQVHTGIEAQVDYKVNNDFFVSAIASLGNWNYEGETPYRLTNDVTGLDESGNLEINEVKVGRAPQTSFGVSMDYSMNDQLSLDLRYNFYDDHYGHINVNNVIQASIDNTSYEGEKLDSYGLMDFGMTYKFNAGSNDMLLRVNVYNVLDEEYFSALQQYGYYYGNPRSFNVSLKYMF